MRFLRRRRMARPLETAATLENPMAGVANLFDVTVVFCIALLSILLGVHGLMEIFDPDTQALILKKTATGETKMLIKKGKEIKAMKATDRELQGEGVRLGTAYLLSDGTVVYVPD